jgi:hypothetical protein
MRRRSSPLLLVLVALGCSESHNGEPACEPHEPPCAAGFIEWTDESCFMNDASREERCRRQGDGLCHELCTTDADCTDPCRPHCRDIVFFHGGGALCDGADFVRVCREQPVDACDL